MKELLSLLVIGDLHYKVSNISEMLDFEHEIVELVKQKYPTAVVFLGDSLNDHETIHTEALNAFQSMILKVSKLVQVIVLIGNHDYVNNQCFLTTQHPFNAMKLWPNVKIADRPLQFEDCIFVPYVPNGRFIEALNTSGYPWEEAKAIFAHQEFKGSMMGPIMSQTGDDWSIEYPMVFSGHLHDRHRPQENIQYLGIPADRDFGKNPTRSISMLSYELNEWTEELITLNQPRKLTFDLTIEELKAFEAPNNAHCRIHLTGTTSDILAFKKTKEFKSLERLYKIVPKPLDEVEIHHNREHKSYLELLAESVGTENWAVKKAFDEVTQNDTNP